MSMRARLEALVGDDLWAAEPPETLVPLVLRYLLRCSAFREEIDTLNDSSIAGFCSDHSVCIETHTITLVTHVHT